MIGRLSGIHIVRAFSKKVIKVAEVCSSPTLVRIGVVTGAVATAYAIAVPPKKTLCDAAPAVTDSATSTSSSCTTSKTDMPVLYQYQICPFCHRVKAYLDFLKISYSAVEVNPLTKSEISFSKEHKKVPIANIGGELVLDSANIIRLITEKYGKQQMPESFFKDFEEWLEWSDKKLAVMLYPNITRSFDESWECFGYAKDVTEWSAVQQTLVRTAGPVAMFFANGRIKKKYGIVDERKELKEVLEVWIKALGGKKFVHGDEISLADLMVFGTLRSIRHFQTFREVIAVNPELKVWFDNVDALTASCNTCPI